MCFSPKQALKKTLRKLGLDVKFVRNAQPGYSLGGLSYEPVNPYASYAPWRQDVQFINIWGAIRSHTLVDEYRCWELWNLVGQSAKFSGSLIEIGVWRGGTGALIAQQAALSGRPDRVYLCDTFTGVVKAGEQDPCYRGGEHADTSRAIVEQLLFEKLALKNVEILEGIFPESGKTVLEARNERFRFCHIDVDAYQSAKEILGWIWDRMVIGGIVVFDDYGFETCGGITKLVNEQGVLADRLMVHNLNGHGIFIKLPPVA